MARRAQRRRSSTPGAGPAIGGGTTTTLEMARSVDVLARVAQDGVHGLLDGREE
jgi:hypothetical protein